MHDKLNILANMMPNQHGNDGTVLNQENLNPGSRSQNNNQQSSGNQASNNTNQHAHHNNPMRPPKSRPRSSAATSVTSGTSLGTTTVQSGRGQHKLKSRFSVIRKLGKGTYGKVQLAINKETGQEVAIKTIKKSKIENEQDLERVRREIQIMSSIEHPHIVHIYEVFENKDKIVLVMQYAPGGELYEYVSQSKLLDDNEARRLFRQIATAIYYCHQNKICHRDLKLENILLDEKNNAKLADFGLSNVFDKRRQLSTFCGSPLYASPEIVQGSPYEGPEVDCWSLGVLLYTLVYGAMPFDGSNFKRLVKQISDATYFEPKQKSQASPLIRHLLCADPRKRANIVDICTDPWVNGTIPASPPTAKSPGAINESSDQPISRHSLLQVAQDMVKLAPVRLDILLALLPPELVNTNMLPENDQIDSEPMKDITGVELNAPVASYVVRDLEPDTEFVAEMEQDSGQMHSMIVDSESKVGIDNDKMDSRNNDESDRREHSIPVDPDKHTDTENEINKHEQEEKQLPSCLEMQQVDTFEKSVPMEVEMVKSHETSIGENTDPSSPAPNEVITETVVISDIEAPKLNENLSNKDGSVEDREESISEDNLGEKLDQFNGVDESMPNETIHEFMDVAETSSELAQEKPAEQTQSKLQSTNDMDDIEKLSVPTSGMSDGSKSPISDSGQTKPKKKKKIIVVKKVVKKSKGGAASSKESRAEETKADDNNNNDSNGENRKQLDDNEAALNKETTREPEEAGGVNNKRKQSNSSAAAASMRRRSTLVAEMSDKLLQQLAADALSGAASPNAALKMEQAALFGQVNVTEKKEDFERRASLLLTEPDIEHFRRPSFDRLIKEKELDQQRDTVPQKLSSTDTSADLQEINRSDTVETLKATAPAHALDELDSSSFLSSPTTVTCEWDEPAAEGGVRSSIEINLKTPSPKPIHVSSEMSKHIHEAISDEKCNLINSDQPSTSLSSGRASAGIAAVGPVPITRSYKKVTFTKDGACITETGKVYSAKGEDGTMRRIERKSKVTHYPANQAEFNSSGASKKVISKQMEETTSEMFSTCSTSASGSRVPFDDWPSKTSSGLERLVMPSTSLLNDDATFVFGDNDNLGADEEDFFKEIDHRHQFKQRPISRLINDDPSSSFDLGFKRAGVAHSESNASSCSSTSTDVFDDIFDNWTGAISMFDRKNNRLRNSFERRFGPDLSLFNVQHAFLGRQQSGEVGGGTRRRKVSSSGSATGHCESADQAQTIMSSGMTKQDSASSSRPASAFDGGYHYRHGPQQIGSARPFGLRHGFGGSRPNLFFDKPLDETPKDPFEKLFDTSETDDLMRRISIKHSQLHKQLSASQQKLWRGSTPSLFEANTDAHTSVYQDSKTLRREQQQRAFVGGSGRIPAAAAPPRPPASPRMSGRHLDETASPLDARPMRRNMVDGKLIMGASHNDLSHQRVQRHARESTTNKSDVGSKEYQHQVEKTISRTSLISDRLSQVHLSQSSDSSSRRHQTASFIELKRNSSSSLGPGQTTTFVESRQQPAFGSTITSISTMTSTTATPPDVRTQQAQIPVSTTTITQTTQRVVCDPEATDPAISGRQATSNDYTNESVREHHQQSAEATDMRIQSWLQESSSNFSSSSGSKSSASFGTIDGHQALRADNSFGNIHHQQANSATTPINIHTIPNHIRSSNQQPQQSASPSSTTISSSGKRIINIESLPSAGVAGQVPIEKKQIIKTISTASLNKATSSTTTTTKTTTTNFSTTLMGNSINQIIPGDIQLKQSIIGGQTGTATITTMSSSMVDDFFANDDLFCEHQSQSTSSSKSILDQLRTRGLRSVLNQRLVDSTATATSYGGAATDSGLAMTEQAASSPISSQSSAGGFQETRSSSIISSQRQDPQQLQHRKPDNPLKQLDSALRSAGTNLGSNDKNPDINIDLQHKIEATNNDDGDSMKFQPINGDAEMFKSMESTQLNGLSAEVDGEEDDEDECLKTARANIKAYKDRMKETDLFLKSLAVADDETQRQRQELFLYNDLMIRNKLNSLASRLATPSLDLYVDTPPMSISKAGYCSAPVQQNNSRLGQVTNPLSMIMVSGTLGMTGSGLVSCEDDDYTKAQHLRASTGGEDWYMNWHKVGHGLDSDGGQTNGSFQTYRQSRLIHLDDQSATGRNIDFVRDGAQTPPGRATLRAQSLAPDRYQSNFKSVSDDASPLARSTFQPTINTEFLEWKPSARLSLAHRPLSDRPIAASNNSTPAIHINRNRRSSSVARHTSYDTSRAACKSSIYMTEYQRAFGTNNKKPTNDTFRDSRDSDHEETGFSAKRHYMSQTSSPRISTMENFQWQTQATNEQVATTKNEEIGDDEDMLIEQSMSAYRPSSYVPKVVPQGLPARRSPRSYQRRSLTFEWEPRRSYNLYEDRLEKVSTKPLDRQQSTATTITSPTRRISGSQSTNNNYAIPSDNHTSRNVTNNREDMNKYDHDEDHQQGRRNVGWIASYTSGEDVGVDQPICDSTDRLSELESRLEANKRRREELLAASKRESPALMDPVRSRCRRTTEPGLNLNDYDLFPVSKNNNNDHKSDETTPFRARSLAREQRSSSPSILDDKSSRWQRSSMTSGRLVPRSSRLECMEARIKRRSYCIRVEDSSIQSGNHDLSRHDSLDRSRARRQSDATEIRQ